MPIILGIQPLVFGGSTHSTSFPNPQILMPWLNTAASQLVYLDRFHGIASHIRLPENIRRWRFFNPASFHKIHSTWEGPHQLIWMFRKIVVPPKSSILIGFSIINHPFWGTPIFGNTHIETLMVWMLPFQRETIQRLTSRKLAPKSRSFQIYPNIFLSHQQKDIPGKPSALLLGQ